MWSEEQKKAGIVELREDPLSLGYSRMTDQEVADAMERVVYDAPPGRGYVSAWEIYRVLTHEELLAWYVAAQGNLELKMLWELWMAALQANQAIDPVDVDMPGVVDASQRKTLLQRLFLAGKSAAILGEATVAKVEGLAPKVSRREYLGLPQMTSGWVAWLREAM